MVQAVKTGSLTNEVWENGYKEGQTVFNTTLAGIAAGSSWKQKTLHVPGVIVTKGTVCLSSFNTAWAPTSRSRSAFFDPALVFG